MVQPLTPIYTIFDWAFLQTEIADFPTLSYTLTSEIPTLSHT